MEVQVELTVVEPETSEDRRAFFGRMIHELAEQARSDLEAARIAEMQLRMMSTELKKVTEHLKARESALALLEHDYDEHAADNSALELPAGGSSKGSRRATTNNPGPISSLSRKML